jgi:hypothetical protein
MRENFHTIPAAMAAALRETTPADVSPLLESFAVGLTDETPVRVPVRPVAGAASGWCHRNVAHAVAAQGGRAVFGWTIWCCSLFATAEFHAVHVTAEGNLVDVTPKTDGETEILFAPDYRFGRDFDFMHCPRNERFRLYDGPSAESRAADLIAVLSSPQEKFERGRAASNGLTLEAWIASRMKPDALETAIDRFLAACKAAEALLEPTPQGQYCNDIPLYRTLDQRRQDSFARLLRTWGSHPARLLGTAVATGPAETHQPDFPK